MDTLDKESFPLDAFISEIKKAVDAIPSEQLKHNIISYASELPPARRLEFFQIISFEDFGDFETSHVDFEEDLQLTEDVEAFYQNICVGVYNHTLDIHNPDEVPSWVDDMDVLFSRTDDAFLSGDFEKSSRAYSFLFSALHVAEDIAVEHKMYSAQDIVITDVSDAKAKYLRSLYEIAPREERAAALYDVMQENYALGNVHCGIEAIDQAFPIQIENVAVFAEIWIAFLNNLEVDDTDDFEAVRRWLVREAVLLSRGVDGLEALADTDGQNHPEIFFDLVTSYVDVDDVKKAEAVCVRGIEKITSPHQQAVLADWLAKIAEKDNDMILALKHRRQAWRFEPTQRRLVNWCSTLNQTPDDTALREEISFLESLPGNNYVRLISMLEVLAGDYDKLCRTLLDAEPLGWKLDNHPGFFLLPVTLIAGAGLKELPEMSQLYQISEDIKGLFVRWEQETNEMDSDEDFRSYLDFLFPALQKHPLSEEERITFLRTAHTVLLKRLRAISNNHLEYAYHKVANQVAAFVEVCLLSSRDSMAESFLTTVRNRFLRNTGLRSEIKLAMGISRIIPVEFFKTATV